MAVVAVKRDAEQQANMCVANSCVSESLTARSYSHTHIEPTTLALCSHATSSLGSTTLRLRAIYVRNVLKSFIVARLIVGPCGMML